MDDRIIANYMFYRVKSEAGSLSVPPYVETDV